MKQHPARERVLRRLRVYLEQRHYPRLTLAAILALGGATGFLASAGLLALGLHSMAWRYGLAALLGYAVFLLGLRLWLSLIDRQRRNFDGDLGGFDSLPDHVGGEPSFHFGGGGGFSGGGAGGPLESVHGVEVTPAAEVASEATGAAADAVGGLDLGEGAAVVILPVLLVGVVIAGLASVVLVLTGAPGLLAELLLDGVIAGAVYRRLREVPTQHWLHGAVRRTWKPMLALILILVAVGLVAQWLTPAADSIGDFFRP